MKYESNNAKELHKERKFNYDRINKYQKKYLDPNTGSWKTKYTVKRPCPVCSSTVSNLCLSKSGGSYHKCSKCSMIFTNPVFNDESLTEYYTYLDTGQGEIVENESSFYREIYSKGLFSIERIKDKGLILDVGCSTGFFLDIAKENQWQTFGLELGLEEAKVAADKGHDIVTCTVDKTKFKEKFDAITLWDVFEHIPDPHTYLKQLSRILKKDGIIFMQIPNSGALAPRILQEKCNMFDGLEHCNLYNKETIEYVTKKNGFNLESIESVISEISVLNNYVNYEQPYFGSAKSNILLSGLIDEDSIHKNFLGYKLQVIIRNKN